MPSPDTSSIAIAWSPPALVQTQLVGYRILVRDGSGTETVHCELPADATAATVSGLERNGTFDVTVEAVLADADPVRSSTLSGSPARPPLPVYIEVPHRCTVHR